MEFGTIDGIIAERPDAVIVAGDLFHAVRPTNSAILHAFREFTRLRKTDDDYDPTDRDRVYAYLRERQSQGEVPTGLLYIDADANDMHGELNTVEQALATYPFEKLCPGKEALEELMETYR